MRWILMAPVCLAGCGLVPERGGVDAVLAQSRVGVSTDAQVRPQARPADGADAVRPVVPGGALGRTVASLGDAAEPGLWLKTPLVQVETPGRVSYGVTGKSVAVTLIPIAGPVTAGSRLSLQAMYELGAPLTGLPEIDVFAGG
jgi:hypothetical protein